MRGNPLSTSPVRGAVAALGLAGVLLLAACGGDAASGQQVASLDDATGGSSSDDATSTTVDVQDALLAYAQCMRDNGVDMDDPTFDADGNPNGFGIGPDSGIDPRSDEFQAAQEACGDLLQGVGFGPGGGGRGGIDRDAIQESLADFTACLRDQGLEVDDITFGGPGGTPPGGAAGGAAGDGAANGAPPGGFGGPPGSVPQGGPGQGFDPTDRIIEQLGLDADDPAVTAALDACQPILEDAFQPPTSTTAAD